MRRMSSRLVVSPLWAASVLCAVASAQQNLHSRLAPITAPIRHAGVYHVATGTWTRHASLANVTGPDTIYNNTCAAYYFAPMDHTESFQHRSRIPSPSGPTTPSVFYGPPRNDEAPGCRTAYTVNGFEFAYCSAATTTVDWTQEFANTYMLCGGGDMIPDYTITATGLPGGHPNGAQNCWIVDIDLSGTSGGGIVLSADGDGTYAGPSTAEQFGWSFTQSLPLATHTGPIVAGDFTFTGNTTTGPLTPCTGTDGTIWDNPIHLAEPGTGMASNNFYRIATFVFGPPPTAGCYWFGGDPHADFWLKLYANPGCAPPNPLTAYCFPGEGGIRACTACAPPNPPSAHGRGCDNYGQHTGGAQLTATGTASVSADTVVLTSSFENDIAFTILLQGTVTSNSVFGAGIRCVAGNLRRIYNGPAGSSVNGDAAGEFHRPGPADGTSVHQASLNHGYDIGANVPVTLYYLAYYRDPAASAHCGSTATFNASQSGSMNWVP
jgi:hypothetical protein